MKLHSKAAEGKSECLKPLEEMSSPFLRTTILLVALLAVLEATVVARTGQPTVEDALKAIERGDYSQAEALLATNSGLQVLKGIVEFHQGKYRDARETLAQAVAQRDEPLARQEGLRVGRMLHNPGYTADRFRHVDYPLARFLSLVV